MSRCHPRWALVVLGVAWVSAPHAVVAQSPDFDIGAPISIAAGTEAGVQAIALADLNKDGRTDIIAIAADQDEGPIAILLNQGAGVFGDPQFVVDDNAVLSDPVGVAVADFGSVSGGPDGNLDILVADVDGFAILFGDGQGAFVFASEELTEVEGLDIPKGVAVGDFDGANGPDFAIIDEQGVGDNGQVYFLCNVGQAGLFDPCATIALNSGGAMPVDVGTGDFNGDNHTDVVVLNEGPLQAGDGNLTLFLGNGDGSFTQPRTGVFPIARHARDLVVADLNPDQDTIDDVAAVTDDIFDPDNLFIFLGGTSGAIFDRTRGALELGATALATGNFSGTDRIDIAGANDEMLGGGASLISIATGDGAGSFANPLIGGQLPGGAISMMGARLNSDALVDLVVLNLDQDELRIAINNTGSATKTPTITPTPGPATPTRTPTSIPVVTPELEACTVDLQTANPQTIVRGDFDGDGDEDDLAVLDPTAQRLLVLIVDRAKLTGDKAVCGFDSRTEHPLGGTFTSLTSADVNHDGRTDLVVAGDSGLKVLLGSGGGSFSAPQVINVVTPSAAPTFPTPTPGSTLKARSVATGDFDRNGIEDLAIVNGQDLLILTGTGDGATFCQRQAVRMDNGAIVVAVKLDSSSFIDDLAVASNPGNAVTILLSASSATTDSCSAQNLFPVPTRGYPSVSLGSGRPTAMVRMQSSGEVDALLVSARVPITNRGSVFVIKGGTDGFKLSTTIDVAGATTAVDSGDLVGRDGRIDIVTAFPSGGSGTLSFFSGQQDGSFGTVPIMELVGRNPSSLVVGYFDSDEQIDLAVVNSGDGSLTFFLSSRVAPTPTPTYTNTPGPTSTVTETPTPGPTNSPTLTPRFTAAPTGTFKEGAFALSSCSIAQSTEREPGTSIGLLLGAIVVIRLRRRRAGNLRR